jgi:hypothetical protein
MSYLNFRKIKDKNTVKEVRGNTPIEFHSTSHKLCKQEEWSKIIKIWTGKKSN